MAEHGFVYKCCCSPIGLNQITRLIFKIAACLTVRLICRLKNASGAHLRNHVLWEDALVHPLWITEPPRGRQSAFGGWQVVKKILKLFFKCWCKTEASQATWIRDLFSTFASKKFLTMWICVASDLEEYSILTALFLASSMLLIKLDRFSADNLIKLMALGKSLHFCWRNMYRELTLLNILIYKTINIMDWKDSLFLPILPFFGCFEMEVWRQSATFPMG